LPEDPKKPVLKKGSVLGKVKNILGEGVFFHRNQTYIMIMIIIMIIIIVIIIIVIIYNKHNNNDDDNDNNNNICILTLGFNTHPEEKPRF
jgi:uncharacterized membrane protein